MSSSEITISNNIMDCSISLSGSHIAILTTVSIEVYAWDFRPKPALSPKKIASLIFTVQSPSQPKVILRQILVHTEDCVKVLSHFETGASKISIYQIEASSGTLTDTCVDSVPFGRDEGGLIRNIYEYTWQHSDNGSNLLGHSAISSSIVHSSSEMLLVKGVEGQQDDVGYHSPIHNGQAHKHAHLFSLSRKGELFADGKLLARGCTSFVTTQAHLIFTTSQQLLKFVHIYASDGRSSEAH